MRLQKCDVSKIPNVVLILFFEEKSGKDEAERIVRLAKEKKLELPYHNG